MNTLKKFIPFALSGVLLAGCFGPQMYFSTVFNEVYETYQLTENASNAPNMNYALQVTMVAEGKTSTYAFAFFTSGYRVTAVTSDINQGVATTRTLTVVYDYAENGLFASRVFANEPGTIERAFERFTSNTFDDFQTARSFISTNLNDENRRLITNQATNLLIGGQPLDAEVKNYNIPIGNFVSLENFQSLTKFTPTSVALSVAYIDASRKTTIIFNAQGENDSFLLTMVFENAYALVASDYLLSNEQKALYQGYKS
jgi:hypothetical protein